MVKFLIQDGTQAGLKTEAVATAEKIQVTTGLMFGKLMMQEVNVLIMDEPTNHMNIEVIEIKNKKLHYFQDSYDEYVSAR